MNIIVAILLLGFIIIIHELGHFLLAKKNGITVTEFSVGMGPRIASFVRNGTRYSLKVFPFGGSCMMLGEDETVEDEGAFHKKSVWARFSVIFAGAFFNFILAFVLALIVVGSVGVDYPDVTGSVAGTPAAAAGLQAGDRITEINGRKIHFSREIDLYFAFHPMNGDTIDITYLRDGKKFTTQLTPAQITEYRMGFSYSSEKPNGEVLEIDPNMPLGKQGVVKGDVIVRVDGTEIVSGTDLQKYFEEHPMTNQPVTLTVDHAGETRDLTVTPEKVTYYQSGLDYNYRNTKVSAFETVKNSFYELKFYIRYALDSVVYIVTGKASAKEISGPVGIVNAVGQIVSETKSEGIRVVLLSLASFCILISTNLGVINLLPLPALDGGRLVFLLIEAVRGKPVPKEKEAIVHFVGMALLMVLMVFVLFNDIRNIFVK
jgi:regulator of sigma E protease